MKSKTEKNTLGVGASPLRKEDARHLAGRGRFVADIPFENGLEAAIIRVLSRMVF